MEGYDLHHPERERYYVVHDASSEFPYDSRIAERHRRTRASIPEPVRREITEEVELENLV